MNRDSIIEEIEFEKKILKNYKAIKTVSRKGHLVCQDRNGYKDFFYCVDWESKRKYIRKGDKLLDELYRKRYVKSAINVLSNNIKMLREMEKNFKDFDTESINQLLPKSYQKAYDYLVASPPEPGAVTNFKGTEVIQSENPKNRHQLVHRVSNDLMVRSKNEMIIEEMLISYGLRNRYEKALTLYYTETDDYGNFNYRSKTVYPDFTIFLENGETIYWEHEGMMDDERYRNNNIEKMKLYFMNGIYVPDKLIITMDGDGSPMDSKTVRTIIEEFVLPRIDGKVIL